MNEAQLKEFLQQQIEIQLNLIFIFIGKTQQAQSTEQKRELRCFENMRFKERCQTQLELTEKLLETVPLDLRKYIDQYLPEYDRQQLDLFRLMIQFEDMGKDVQLLMPDLPDEWGVLYCTPSSANESDVHLIESSIGKAARYHKPYSREGQISRVRKKNQYDDDDVEQRTPAQHESIDGNDPIARARWKNKVNQAKHRDHKREAEQEHVRYLESLNLESLKLKNEVLSLQKIKLDLLVGYLKNSIFNQGRKKAILVGKPEVVEKGVIDNPSNA